MKRLLESYSLFLCLFLGVLTATFLTIHMALAPVQPLFDSLGYIMRAYALYGYLHTGQWHAFWFTLSNPVQSILPLHYLLFFLLPSSCTGYIAYVAVHNATTFLLLAYATYYVSNILKRREWAPAIFLITSANNVALNNNYALHLDMPFLAISLLCIGLHLHVWRSKDARVKFAYGLMLGLLFFLKPANALLFFAVMSTAEVAHVIVKLMGPQNRSFGKTVLAFVRQWTLTFCAFIPMIWLGLLCGGGQAILQLVDQNEVATDRVSIKGNELIRIFYFPLSLSAFYGILVLLLLLLVAALADKYLLLSAKRPERLPIPYELSIPIIIALVVLGELFSFEMAVKPLRSLLIMIPAFWFLLFYLWERRGLRVNLLSFVAIAYATLAFGQTVWKIFGSDGPDVEHAYELSDSSWYEMPATWISGPSYVEMVSHRIERKVPENAVICVTSLFMWSMLSWELESPDLLQGLPPRREVRYLLNYKGNYCSNALVGANVIAVVILSPEFGGINQSESARIFDYGQRHWTNEDDKGWFLGKRKYDNSQIGAVFVLRQPLTETDVEKINRSSPFSDMTWIEGSGSSSDFTHGRHYFPIETRNLLSKWLSEKFK